MASFRKITLKDGRVRYKARVTLAGMPFRAATLDKMMDAKAWAAKAESDMRLSRKLPDMVAAKHTVAELIDEFIRVMEAEKQNTKHYNEAKKSRLLWWKREIGHFSLLRLDVGILSQCKTKLHSTGRKGSRSNGTVLLYLTAFSNVINYAVDVLFWLDKNPMKKVKKPGKTIERVRYLREKEVVTLLERCNECVKKPLYEIVWMALATGARKSEILQLKLKDVDLESGVAIAYDTKNGEPSALHLSVKTRKILSSWLEQRPLKHSDYLFSGRGSKADVPVVIDRDFRTALKRADISNFHFHDLRHTAASHLAMNGATSMEISEFLHHRNLALVKRYAHLCQSHLGNVVQSMNDKLFEGVGE